MRTTVVARKPMNGLVVCRCTSGFRGTTTASPRRQSGAGHADDDRRAPRPFAASSPSSREASGHAHRLRENHAVSQGGLLGTHDEVTVRAAGSCQRPATVLTRVPAPLGSAASARGTGDDGDLILVAGLGA